MRSENSCLAKDITKSWRCVKFCRKKYGVCSREIVFGYRLDRLEQTPEHI